MQGRCPAIPAWMCNVEGTCGPCGLQQLVEQSSASGNVLQCIYKYTVNIPQHPDIKADQPTWLNKEQEKSELCLKGQFLLTNLLLSLHQVTGWLHPPTAEHRLAPVVPAPPWDLQTRRLHRNDAGTHRRGTEKSCWGTTITTPGLQQKPSQNNTPTAHSAHFGRTPP